MVQPGGDGVRDVGRDQDEASEDEDDEGTRSKAQVNKQGRAIQNPYGSGNWRNPYGPQHRVSLPQATRTQRLASVMRVIGHPLSIMRAWPETIQLVGASESKPKVAKAIVMAEQKAIAAHRAALEKTIERLAAQRDPLRAKLESIESELKTLLAMRKAAGPIDEDEPLDPDIKPAKGKRKLTKHAATAVRLIAKHSPLTPADLADVTKQSAAAASQTLASLVKSGLIKKIKRGTFEAVS